MNNTEPLLRNKATESEYSSSLESSFQSLIRSSGPVEVVFIDFFDTIVGRRVEPEYVKNLWAKRIRHAAGITTWASRIHELRVMSEAALCNVNALNGFDDEFRYVDLCREIFASLQRLSGISEHLTLAEFTHLSESVEIEIEKRTQFTYPAVIDFLQSRKRENIPVYVVSDSFLSPRQFSELIRHHSLDRLIAGFFLSSDRLLAKRSGRIYPLVMETLGISPSSAIMLGDNYVSDVENSARHAIRGIHVHRDLSSEKRLNDSTAAHLLGQVIKGNSWIRSSVFGELPLSVSFFVRVLYRRATQLGLKDLLFCSREGLILKELFDSYQTHLGVSGRIRTHYFYTSRLSSFLPSLKSLECESFERLFRQYRKLSLRTFLFNLQFTESDIIAIATELEIDAEKIEDDFPSSNLFSKLENLEFFQQRYELYRVTQRDYLLSYIAGFYPNQSLPKHIALVDIGWKGTIQDNIRALLPDEILLSGLYLGLVASGASSPINRKEGLLFYHVPSSSPFSEIFAETCALFEILLSAVHEGVEGYIREGDTISPHFGRPEKTPQICEQISTCQESIKKAFDELLSLSAFSHLDEDEHLESFARRHARMVLSPSREELQLISSLEHTENFGLFNNTSFFIPESLPLRQRILNAMRYVKDPKAIRDSSLWPALSLTRHGLEWLQPWYSYAKMKRVFNS